MKDHLSDAITYMLGGRRRGKSWTMTNLMYPRGPQMRTVLTYEYDRHIGGGRVVSQIYWCARCTTWHEHRRTETQGVEKCDTTVRTMGRNQRVLRPADKLELKCIGPLPDMCRDRDRFLLPRTAPPVDVNKLIE